MDAIIQQFFNLDIMDKALPLVLSGLKQTILICLVVIPLGLAGGLPSRSVRCRVFARSLGGDRRHRLLSRHSAAGAADFHLFRAAVRGLPAVAR